MNSLTAINRQVRYIVVAAGLIVATIFAGVVPALVSAAQLTERSIALSSSSISATGVTYEVNFTSVGAAGAVVVDFCSDSPVLGETCTAPTGFSVTGATTPTAGFTEDVLDSNTIALVGTIAATTQITIEIDDVTNPSAAGPMYARMITYDNGTNAAAYTSTNRGSGFVDEGGAAISIYNTIGVSGAVLETMTFCVSAGTISEDCAGATTPVIELGETVGDVTALVPTAVSEGTIYTQISTNADTGAVVSIKSNAAGCGGLLRAGSPAECDIQPALNTGIAAGEAKFGVRTATATDTGLNAAGIFQPVTGSGYNNSTFALNYTVGDATGVTSVFGDPFLDTGDAPVNNKNMELTFGVSINNNTPAGLYSADLSLIATGKF